MAQISEIKVTLKSKSIFDKNEQQLEATIHMDDNYPFMSIKTERWDGLDEKSLKDMTDAIFTRIMDAYFLLEKEI